MGTRNNVRSILNAARHGFWDEDMEDEIDTDTERHNNRPTFNRPDDWN